MTEAFPLKWPQGWPRHKGTRDNDRRFNGPTYRWDRVFKGLHEELARIGANHVVVSTNQPLRRDGYPYAQERHIDDPGVAVYFTRGKKTLVMAQDRFDTVMGNMRSLTMAIEGLRQMERHGGATMMERAFDGFTALPPPMDFCGILGTTREAIVLAGDKYRAKDHIMDSFRNQARRLAETGGDMDRLVKARDKALEAIGV